MQSQRTMSKTRTFNTTEDHTWAMFLPDPPWGEPLRKCIKTDTFFQLCSRT